MRVFKALDTLLIDLFQWVYDLFLDVFGCRLGSFSIATTVAGQFFFCLLWCKSLFHLDKISYDILVFFFCVLATFISSMTVFIVRFDAAKTPYIKLWLHMNTCQQRGRFQPINNLTLLYKNDFKSRIIVCWFCLPVCILFHMLPNVVNVCLGFVMREYLMCIMLRERDPDRFKLPQNDLVGGTA